STTATADTQGRLRATIADTTAPTNVTARPTPVVAMTKRLPTTATHSGGNGPVVHECGRTSPGAEDSEGPEDSVDSVDSVGASCSGVAAGSGVEVTGSPLVVGAGPIGPATGPYRRCAGARQPCVPGRARARRPRSTQSPRTRTVGWGDAPRRPGPCLRVPRAGRAGRGHLHGQRRHTARRRGGERLGQVHPAAPARRRPRAEGG